MSAASRAKRMRTSFKHHQLRTMKSYFSINHNPDAKDLKQLSQKTGLPKRVLQVISKQMGWWCASNVRVESLSTLCDYVEYRMYPFDIILFFIVGVVPKCEGQVASHDDEAGGQGRRQRQRRRLSGPGQLQSQSVVHAGRGSAQSQFD